MGRFIPCDLGFSQLVVLPGKSCAFAVDEATGRLAVAQQPQLHEGTRRLAAYGSIEIGAAVDGSFVNDLDYVAE